LFFQITQEAVGRKLREERGEEPEKLHLDCKFTTFKPKSQRPKITGEIQQIQHERFNIQLSKNKKKYYGTLVKEVARASTAGPHFRFPYTSTVTFRVLRASTDTGHTQIQQSAQVHRINHKPDRSAEAKSY